MIDSQKCSTASLPSRELARQQAMWLRSARSRLMRHVNVTRCQSILELGAGWGDVSVEMAERSQANIIAIDLSAAALQSFSHPQVRRIQGDAHRLPISNQSIDVVVTQCAFLWFAKAEAVVHEISRVLTPEGAVALVEPDFGGLMEYPSSIALRDIWISALTRHGADPFIGRKLPGMFAAQGFRVDTLLMDRVAAPSRSRFDLLAELTLTPRETRHVGEAIRGSDSQQHQFVHLPFTLIAAARSRSS